MTHTVNVVSWAPHGGKVPRDDECPGGPVHLIEMDGEWVRVLCKQFLLVRFEILEPFAAPAVTCDVCVGAKWEAEEIEQSET